MQLNTKRTCTHIQLLYGLLNVANISTLFSLSTVGNFGEIPIRQARDYISKGAANIPITKRIQHIAGLPA